MADLDLQSLGMRLGEAITPTPSNAPQVRYATVAAVNADGTLDVTIDGTTLRGVCATTGCVGAQAGMRCVVLRQGPLATVVGLIAGTDLGSVYLQGGLNLENNRDYASAVYGKMTDDVYRSLLHIHNDTVQVGYGSYDAQAGATHIWGNSIILSSRDKRLQLESGNYLNDLTTGTATINSTYLSGGNIFLYKLNGFVYCMWAELKPKVTATRTTVATIPAAFRPWATVYAPHTTIATSEYVLIYNNGNFQMEKLTNGSSRWGSACWVAAQDANNAG